MVLFSLGEEMNSVNWVTMMTTIKTFLKKWISLRKIPFYRSMQEEIPHMQLQGREVYLFGETTETIN